MKKLIWGCTQMIVGMLGVIASLIFLCIRRVGLAV